MSKLFLPPCYKYIARSLSSPEERYEFSRRLLDKLSSSGADPDECMILYSSLSFPTSAGDPLDYEGAVLNAQDYYNAIMGLEGISNISCPQYYKNRLKPNNQNNLCQLCDLSRSCKTTNYVTECSILKYIVSDKENFKKFEELGVDGVFKSVYDIAVELSFDAPAIVPLLNTAYSVIRNQPDDVYSVDDVKSRLQRLVGMIIVDAGKNPSVLSVQMNNNRALPVAWEKVISDVLSAKDFNYDEVCTEVSKIDLSSGKRKKSSKKKKALVPESPVFDYLDKVNSEQVHSQEAAPIEESELSSDDVPIVPESKPTDDGTLINDDEELPFGSAENVVPGNDPAAEQTESYSDSDIVSEDPADDDYNAAYASASDQSWYEDTDDVSSGESNVSEPERTEQPSNADIESENSAESEDNNATAVETTEPVDEKKILKYRVPPIDEGDLIFNIVVNRKTFKSYASAYNSMESTVFTALQKSKRLPLEIIYDENGAAYLFMFVRALGQFVYCPIEQDMPNSIIAIMLSKSVVKICYQPYFLYSLLRIYNIRACGVYSICTVDSLLHPEAQIAFYNDFFSVYAGDFPNLVPVDSGFPDFDSLLLNLQKYILIHARQTRSQFDKLEYAKRHARDEVLGSSFLRNVNLMSNDYLFSLESNGKVVYNQNFEQRAHSDGFFVTYSVAAEDIGTLSQSDLYLDALFDLCNKGRFRKYNIQLVTITSTAMVLFIGESEYELLTTALQKYFNRYALVHRMEKFELNVAHQRIYYKTKKGAKQGQIPRTYEQAMDLLVTTNDTVSVSESHVVKRGKKKRKAQTQSFKPT